jgi:hypothetical protein
MPLLLVLLPTRLQLHNAKESSFFLVISFVIVLYWMYWLENVLIHTGMHTLIFDYYVTYLTKIHRLICDLLYVRVTNARCK